MTDTTTPEYERHKKQAHARQREISTTGREIADGMPPVANPERKDAARGSFRSFCLSYFPEVFYLEFSPDHERIIERVEEVVLRGGQHAMAMPRGTGKSAICAAAVMWAALYGVHLFVILIGSTERAAEELLEGIRMQLETNDLLLEDFPEVCYPIRRLEGISQRRLLWEGELVRIELTQKAIVLPSLPENPASSVVITVSGLTGRIRGRKNTRPDGGEVRPTLALIDDPQTDESAQSPSQCKDRERIINGAVLGLAGPGNKIAALMPCTVIAPDDLADRILNRDKNPQWHGERTKMVNAWPTNEPLWEQYATLRKECQRADKPTTEATKFYEANRTEMDKGAALAWPARMAADDEISALQHAMNLRIDRGDAAFMAEYQNEPIADVDEAQLGLSVEVILRQLNRFKRKIVPLECSHLTAFTDVHKQLLYWIVCAWKDDFTGYVIDYGTLPEQPRNYFSLRDAKVTLQRQGPKGASLEAQLHAGLKAWEEKCLSKTWKREDGAEMRIGRALVDAGWKSDIVSPFCRSSKHTGILMPSKGRSYRATGKAMLDFPKQPGELRGRNMPWRVPPPTGQVRRVEFDSNRFKSFVADRLRVSIGDKGCLSINAAGKKPGEYRCLADHLSAERPKRMTAETTGLSVDEWFLLPGRDNHWWDCLVGNAVAASMLGCELEEFKAPKRIVKKKKRQHVGYL